jgi:hypothetical protein
MIKVGDVIRNWTVLGKDNYSDGHSKWECICKCGRAADMSTSNLYRGKTNTCVGCYSAHNQLEPYEALYNLLCRSSKCRAEVKLTYKQYLKFVGLDCHYCGDTVPWVPHINVKKGVRGSAYNLDRKNNSLGYSRSNCVVCCARCNRAKSNHFTYEEWVEIGEVIRSWHT